MGYGNILTQILQQGMQGGRPSGGRFGNAANNLGGGGMDGIFGQIQDAMKQAGVSLPGADAGNSGGAAPQTRQASAAGGIIDKAQDFLRGDQIGGLSGAQLGGIGAAAGALLGGGVGGAARGGMMAVLGTLALGALNKAKAKAQNIEAGTGQEFRVETEEVKSLIGPDSEKLMLKSMLSAAKADGKIDQAEMQNIIGKISEDDVTPEEKQFVLAEMKTPIDIAGLASEVRTPAQAAQVYGAALMAIDVDTDNERRYLAELAQALRLDRQVVAQLHEMTGAPS